MVRIRERATARRTGITVLVVDDQEDYRLSTRALLEREGFDVLTAVDGPSALAIHAEERPDVMLVDYFMPGMTGEEVVRQIRATDRLVRVILVTGYAGERPAIDLLRSLDLQGYHDKGRGAADLLLWVEAAVNTYRHVREVQAYREGLQYMLDATAGLFGESTLTDLLDALTRRAAELFRARAALLATVPLADIRGMLRPVPRGAAARLQLRSVLGARPAAASLEDVDAAVQAPVLEAFESGRMVATPSGTALPLQLGTEKIGVLHLDQPIDGEPERSFARLFLTQARLAIQNLVLYEHVTLDEETGVFRWSHLLQRLEQALLTALGWEQPVSVLVVEVPGLGAIARAHGEEARSAVLLQVAGWLQEIVEEKDSLGRYGSACFLAVFPEAGADEARAAAERLIGARGPRRAAWGTEEIELELRVGIATLRLEAADRRRAPGPDELGSVARALVARAFVEAAEQGGATLSWPDLLAADGGHTGPASRGGA